MGKYKVACRMAAYDTERLAAVFEKYGIYHELKKNGSLWVSDSFYKNKEIVEKAFHALKVEVGLGLERDFPTFDHPWHLLKKDKTYVLSYSPYAGTADKKWGLLMARANEFGLNIVKAEPDEWFYSPSCNTYIITLI